MRHILQSFLKRLSNLTSKNRSLFLPRISNDQYIDIHDFDFITNKPSFSLIEDLIAEKQEIVLCPFADSQDGSSNVLSKKIKNLKRIEKFISEESGSRDLYVGWPFLKGKLNDETIVRCPLIYFPVNIEEGETEWILKLRSDINISFNKTFFLAYAFYNQIKISDGLLEFTFDDFEKESRAFRTRLFTFFKDHAVKFHFNQENFLDKLQPFKNYNKQELDESLEAGELKLFPEAVLGLFPQADSFLVPDYEEMLENKDFKGLEEFFISKIQKEEYEKAGVDGPFFALNFLNKVKEEQTFTPYHLDAYQENAIKAVKQGNSVVVQGPPGSGKSELICNLMADFIARGKRVLLVCQKRAALDVVYKRLEEKELSNFAGLVHDFRNDRRAIYHQIDRQINRLTEFKYQNNSLDAIQLERNFLLASRRIDQITEELAEFKHALFDQQECGVSIKELYLTSEINSPKINIKQEYQYFKYDNLDNFLRKLKAYAKYYVVFEKEGYVWKGRKSFCGYGLNDFQRITECVEEVPDFKKRLAEQSKDILESPLSLEAAEHIASKDKQIQEMLLSLEIDRIYQYFRHMVDFPDKETDAAWLANMEKLIMGSFEGHGPEVTINAEKLGFYQEKIEHGLKAQKNPLKALKYKFLSKDYAILKKVFQSNHIQDTKEGFSVLIEKIDSRLNLEHNLDILKSAKWLTGIPEELDKVAFQTFFYHQKRAIVAKFIFTSVRNFKEFFNVKSIEYQDLKNNVLLLLELVKTVPIKKNQWLQYLTPAQIFHVQDDTILAERLIKTLQKDFDALCEFDNLQNSLEIHELQVLEKIMEMAPEPKDAHAESIFVNSLNTAWIDHIETKYPILRAVTSQKLQMMEEELQLKVNEKALASKDIVLIKVKENTYKDVEYNRLNNLVTYRGLQHQVTKKKRIWPLRKLVNEHSDELFTLIPCWLASPETVSAIFPMKDFFDLVIFDEASQCFAEKGIPSMYRGKQVVVTGDDKQLQPSNLYQVRWEDEDDDTPELVVDSLLGLCQQYLMQVQLLGHYRSKDLSLIHFSNNNFYEGKLKMLPDYESLQKDEAAINYIKVDGKWINNKNEEEALKVVELIKNLVRQNPEKEIGVVTFNSKQQQHILDVLENDAFLENYKIPDSLFVKNIENVQGDEKDVIIFSTAYAPDQKGRMIMNFGPLNSEGGENRLNVAITRAKEKIFIVSSIYPPQLKVEDAKNEGPKLLKNYLQYALDVSEGNFQMEVEKPGEQNSNWYLKNKILNVNGHYSINSEIVNGLPFADLSIKTKGKYEALLLTDDDLYYKGISVKELHVYSRLLMQQKNWKYITFYSREYWQNPETVIDLILRFINKTEINA